MTALFVVGIVLFFVWYIRQWKKIIDWLKG